MNIHGFCHPRWLSEDSRMLFLRIGDCKWSPNHLISLSLIFHFPCHVFWNYVYFNRFSALKRSGKIDKFKVQGVFASEIHIQVLVSKFKHARVDEGWKHISRLLKRFICVNMWQAAKRVFVTTKTVFCLISTRDYLPIRIYWKARRVEQTKQLITWS